MNAKSVLALCALLPLARPAAAWEEKGHTMINRLAAEAMPADTPAFFKNAVARLAYLGPEPDRWRARAGKSLAAVNPPDHFIDMEYVAGMDLPEGRYKFMAAMQDAGVLTKYKVTADKVGFLPYRIAEMAETLRVEWANWRAAKDGTPEKAQIEQDIIFTAGVMGHFVGDGSNPQHTSVHYNGWDEAFAPNPGGYTTKHGLHGRFEGDFVNAAVSINDVRPLVAPLKPVGNIFTDTVAYLKTTNGFLNRVYDLDKKGVINAPAHAFSEDDPETPEQHAARIDINKTMPDFHGDPEAVRFTEERLAAGASELRDLWAAAMHAGGPGRRGATSATSAPAQDAPATTPAPVPAMPAMPTAPAVPAPPAGASK